jgi:hypothetical protein
MVEKEILTEHEIRLECLRLAVEFASENIKLDPIPVAQNYFDWVMKKNSSEKIRKDLKDKR